MVDSRWSILYYSSFFNLHPSSFILSHLPPVRTIMVVHAREPRLLLVIVRIHFFVAFRWETI